MHLPVGFSNQLVFLPVYCASWGSETRQREQRLVEFSGARARPTGRMWETHNHTPFAPYLSELHTSTKAGVVQAGPYLAASLV
jgi:hypothetical protein